jgi:hypothetical protein
MLPIIDPQPVRTPAAASAAIDRPANKYVRCRRSRAGHRIFVMKRR